MGLIDRSLEFGPPSVTDLASKLMLSTRTLQRELRKDDTSVSELIDAARRSKAVALVDRGLPIDDIAYLLGYTDRPSIVRLDDGLLRHRPPTEPASVGELISELRRC